MAFSVVYDPNSTVAQRKKGLKDSPWWKHYVEALYRGEHLLAKTREIAGPSDHAERAVGWALGISQSTVRKISGEIRRMRKQNAPCANFPPLTLAEYKEWMITGEHPFHKIGRKSK